MSLVQMTLSGGVFILLIVVVRALTLHRLPKAAFLVLWEMAALRLLLPFTIPLPFSVLAPAGQLLEAGAYLAAGEVPVLEPPDMGIPSTPALAGTTPSTVLPTIWLVGMALMTAYFVVFYVRTWRRFRLSTLDNTPAVRRWLAGQRLRRPLEVRQSAQVSSPLTYGILRPVILLPADMERSDETALTYILTHEFIHIRRFDGVTKLVFAAVLCIHWFNPLAWVLYVLANRDLELSCDERVMDTLGGGEKASYALTLINMAEAQNRRFSPYNHFSILAIEERIEAIMKYKKASIVSLVLALALVIGVTAGFATSAQAASENTEHTIAINEERIFQEFVSVGTTGSENTLKKPDGVLFSVSTSNNGGEETDDVLISNEDGTDTALIGIDSRELADNGDALTSLAPGAELLVGTVVVGEGKKITVSITSAYSTEIEVCVTSLDDGTTYRETATIGTEGGSDIVVIQIAVSGEYALSVKNSSSVNVDFSLSYIIR